MFTALGAFRGPIIATLHVRSHHPLAARSTMTTTSSAATNSVALVWYRVGDLRVSDHEPLHLASQSSAVVVPFFCLDDTYLRPVAHPGALGLPSTGPHRLTAMLRAVESLQASLRDRGSDLLCSSGSTVDTLQQLVQALAAEAQRPDRLSLYYYSFPWDASLKEGKNVEGRTALEEAVVDGFQRASAVHGMHAEVHTCWSGSTLYHKDDVMAMSAHSSASSNARNPLEMIANGGSMTDVRRAMQLGTSVRPSLPQPLHMPPVPCSLLAAPLRGQMNLNVGSEGCLRQLYDAAGAGMALITLEQLVLWSLVPGSDLTGCTKEQTANPSPNRPPVAGTVTEAEVTARLKWMLHPDSPFMLGYKDSRMMAGGEDSSAMLSISLSLGTISPRTVYWETLHAMHAVLPRAEGAKGKIPGCGEDGNEWTWREPDSASPGHHWLLMHLGIRDFFLYYSLVHGQALFQAEGPRERNDLTWSYDALPLAAWAQGRTGFPFIDANMRQLGGTGWMSNRGRQNVASFLAKALNSDWRLGAEVFQALLLDHDLALNWGNWAYMAGVGADPRDRLFKTVTQGERYDPHAALIADWVPELAKLPIEARHRPWEAKNEGEVGVPGYPEPIVDPVGQVGKGKRA